MKTQRYMNYPKPKTRREHVGTGKFCNGKTDDEVLQMGLKGILPMTFNPRQQGSQFEVEAESSYQELGNNSNNELIITASAYIA